MSILSIILVVLAAMAFVALVLAVATLAHRRSALEQRFGTEYDRLARRRGTRYAHAEMQRRARERDQLQIRALTAEERNRYSTEWRDLQAGFVDTPRVALREADSLVTRLMNERGYPVEDFESNAAIVSVDHGDVAQNFRDGHRVYLASQHGAVSTDDMRRGIVSYRTLFMELLDEAVPSDAVSR